MKITGIVASACLLGLAGCSTVPLNFTPTNVAPSTIKINGQLVDTTVGLNSTKGNNGQKRRLDVAGAENSVQSLWKSALDDSLSRAAIFSDSPERRFNISVRIDSLSAPGGGVVMHTGTTAHYEVIDRATGQAVFAQDIVSDGRVPGSYAYMAATRARESISRSVQNNIGEFIAALQASPIAGH